MAVIRRNILSNAQSRDDYIRGVKLLKQELPQPGGPSTYDLFVIWHHDSMMRFTPPSQQARNAAHSGPVFLPWHRHMLIELEKNLQRVLNDPTFGLPYWNWGQDGNASPGQQLASALWGVQCMGGGGNPVSSGPFTQSQWRIRVEADPFTGGLRQVNRGLIRTPGQQTPRLPSTAEVQQVSGIATYDRNPWDGSPMDSFRNQLEGWRGPNLHNRVHVWVGGDMLQSTSPNDPVFYLNHANVDRIWSAWLSAHPSQYLPRQTDATAPVGHRIRDRVFSIFPPRPRPRDLLNVSGIYGYDTLA